jgi:HK97 family phage portal protein
VSRILQALGREKRLAPPSLIPAMPAGYGTPGYGWWSEGMVWNAASLADVEVSADQAMRLSAVFGCLRILTDVISTLPFDTFRRDRGIRLPYRPRPAYLSFDPPQESRLVYLSQVMLSLLLDGNAFVLTPRDPYGVPLDLIVLDPTLVTIERQATGRIVYRVLGLERELTALDLMHIRGMVLPGHLRGVSPIRYAREVIAGGSTAQEMGRHVMSNLGVPPAVIEVPADADGGTDEDVQERARMIATAWKQTHGGANAGSVGVLLGGATLKAISISPEDMQWLDSKRMTVQDICRFFGVPPHLVADASNSTSWGSGLAEQNTAFGSMTVSPWTERIEDAHGRLLTTHGLTDVFVRLNLDARLRAAPKDRAETVDIQLRNGSMTINEARALEDRPPVDWGDQPFTAAMPGAPGDGVADDQAAARFVAETVQKLYLGVPAVLSPDEARTILNRAGAQLTGPAPEPASPPAPATPTPGGQS